MTSFLKAMTQVCTEKGALSHGTTGDPRVNLFFKTVRNIPEGTLWTLLDESWAADPLDTLRLIFQTRDCRGGKGEKKIFYDSMKWMISRGHTEILRLNLYNIPFYGTWKDLWMLVNTPIEKDMFELYASTLKRDKKRMLESKPISLAAKWAPTEKGKHDRTQKLAHLLANLMNVDMQTYRKEYLSPLRRYSNIIETKMATNDWGSIEYKTVPSVCLLKHRKAFERHDADRFKAYLEAVKAGKETINAKMIFPHQLVGYYLKNDKYDATIEAQWSALVKHIGSMGKFTNVLSIADVSGSMFTSQKVQPIEVSISLSLLLAEVSEEPFKGQIITFSSDPKFHQVKGSTLQAKVQSVSRMNWGMTTNFQKVFDLIIQRCKRYHVPEENMPQRLYVFSDMQFDSAVGNGWSENPQGLTNHEALVKKYKESGYKIPDIIYWNLCGSTPDFPTTSDESGVALVSGFSPNLLRLFLDNGELNPYSLMRKAIDSVRYKRVRFKNDMEDFEII